MVVGGVGGVEETGRWYRAVAFALLAWPKIGTGFVAQWLDFVRNACPTQGGQLFGAVRAELRQAQLCCWPRSLHVHAARL